MNNVYVLAKGEDYEDDEILGVFASKESAERYKIEIIREFFDVEDDIADEDLEDELFAVTFTIKMYEVKP